MSLFSLPTPQINSMAPLQRTQGRIAKASHKCLEHFCAKFTAIANKIESLTTETAELKETHLGPLANTFSRSPSTSTITPDFTKDEKASISSLPTNDNGIGT